jgi:hypothetical protein
MRLTAVFLFAALSLSSAAYAQEKSAADSARLFDYDAKQPLDIQ